MSLPGPAPSLESLLKHSDWLVRLARRLVGDAATADDLLQDTWLAALVQPPRQPGSVRAWLASVVRRLARARDPQRDLRAARSVVREDCPPADEVVERIEQERLLARLVLELDEPYRKVVLQLFYQGLSAARVAHLEHLPEATVRTRVRRALAQLRERLERESGGERGAWPLASLVALERTVTLEAIRKGILMTTMSTKTTVALSAASGALCALAMTEGILPRIAELTSPSRASMEAAVEPGTLAQATQVERAADPAAPRIELPSPATSSTRRVVEPEHESSLSPSELRRLLFSSKRIDQLRAIELLARDGSPEAKRILVDALLTSKDPVLLALLEEVIAASPSAFAPSILDAFTACGDPDLLLRLSALLTGFAQREPALEHEIATRFVAALEDMERAPERASAATAALAKLGIGALDEVGAFLSDPRSSPEGEGSAASVLTQLSGEHADAVRATLAEALRSMAALDDPLLTDEDRDRFLEKTGSLAWAAMVRPPAEHDRLGEVLLASLLQTHDPAQAGTFAWSLGNLAGLSEDARLGIARDLLGALSTQTNSALCQQYVGVVDRLATEGSVRPNYRELCELVQDARDAQGDGGGIAKLLDRLLGELRREQGEGK